MRDSFKLLFPEKEHEIMDKIVSRRIWGCSHDSDGLLQIDGPTRLGMFAVWRALVKISPNLLYALKATRSRNPSVLLGLRLRWSPTTCGRCVAFFSLLGFSARHPNSKAASPRSAVNSPKKL